ncbi:hypothetical protein NL676_006652 [Syzygium grande]|nr:hypothetical protein NL676_006652 [Syzygium grande]
MEDYGGQGHYEEDNPFAFDGEEEIYEDQQLPQYQHQHQHQQQQQQQTERRHVGREVDSLSGGDGEGTDRRRPAEHRDSSSRKLFVGGISWETTEDRFTNYFSKYGEIADSVIMTDKYSGRPRGFGFVTFADSSVADKVLEECHVIDGREVEVKRTIPREDMEGKSALRTKIFVGGLPAFLSEDELKEYFSFYGGIVEHQIMLDHTTGRSRGFGFVTFAEEDAVERIISEGKVHELGGKQVEIKKAEPKRGGSDYSGSQSKFRGSFNNSAGGYAKEYYPGDGFGGKVGRNFGGGYGGFDGYGGYGSYIGSYGGSSAAFYGGYGYGYGFGGPMYGGSAYGGSSSYGAPSGYGVSGFYAGNRGYGRGGGSGSGSIHGSGKGYGYNSATNGAAMAERYHPYGR